MVVPPKQSFLVRKPWLLGTTILGNPQMISVAVFFKEKQTSQPATAADFLLGH